MEDIKENSIDVRYERDNGVNYVVINSDKAGDWEKDYEIKMLMLNKPQHFLTFTINEIDDKRCIYYDISSKQQLGRLFEYGKVTMEDVKVLFSNISEMVRVVDEYMLNLDRVMLNPKHIYVSLADKKYSFMYLPSDSDISFYDNMRSLFEYILERFDHSVEKSSLVRFYEIYQRILVRDYTPHNLMDFFKDSNELHINDKVAQADNTEPPTDNTELPADYDEVTVEDKEFNVHYDKPAAKPKPAKAVDIGKVRSAQDRHRQDTPKNPEEKVIKAVMPEIIEKDKTKKSSKVLAGAFKLIAAILVLNAAASMFARSYAVIKLGAIGSVVCIIAGFFIFYISGKLADIIGELISEDKVTEDEIMPYRMQMPEGNENIYGNIDDESAEPIYKELVTARVMKDDDKQEAMVNHTMLLSDYLKLLKDNKLTLEMLDNSGAMIRTETKEKYELPSGKLEPAKYPCTIGSLEGSADIFIASPIVSKMHACILQDDDKFYVEDMNSTNGTYVNDERIAMNIKTRIADGDILRVASYNFKVCIS